MLAYVEARPYLEDAGRAREIVEEIYERCDDVECALRELRRYEERSDDETERTDVRILRQKLEGLASR